MRQTSLPFFSVLWSSVNQRPAKKLFPADTCQKSPAAALSFWKFFFQVTGIRCSSDLISFVLAIHKCHLRQISNGTKVTAYQSKPPVMHPYFFRQFSQIRKNCPVHHNGTANTLIFHKKMRGVNLFCIQMTHFVKTSQFFSGTAVKFMHR